MSFFQQLWSLMWKNILLKRRQKVRCLVELILPLFLFFILLWIRLKTRPSNMKECHFKQRSLPSVGSFAFIQSAVCSFDNVCYQSLNDTQIKTDSFSPTELAKLLTEAQEFLTMEKYVRNLEEMYQVVQNTNLSITENEHKMNRSISKDLLENKFFLNTNHDYNQLELNSTKSQIFVNTSYSPKVEFHRLKLLTKDLYENVNKFLQLTETLRLGTDTTRSYIKLVEDLEKKNASSFQIGVAVTYKFLCGNQNSNLLNLILENKSLKKSDGITNKSGFKTTKEKSNEVYNFNTSLACRDKFQIFEKDDTLKYIWWMFKPFIRGKVFYAPSTPATDRIMERFQKTFTSWEEKIKVFVNDIIPAFLKIVNHKSLTKMQELNKTTLGKIIMENLEGSDDMNRLLFDMEERSKIIQKLNSLKLMSSNISDILECFDFNKVKGFSDEEKALQSGMELHEENSLLALIVFIDSGNETLNPRVTYKIRMDEQRVDDTDYIQDALWNEKPRIEPFWDEKYIKYGFAYLQDMLDSYIIEEQTQENNIPGIILQEFPFPCYVKDSFNEQIGFMFPLIMVLSWSFPCAMIIKSIVYEKEKRLKDTMKMMGLRNNVHWCGWFVDSLISMLITICLLTIILKYGKILEGVALSLLFVFLTLYSIATISLAFFISTLFDRANISAAAGGVIFFALYIPYPVLERWTSYFSPIQKCLISLSSNVAFGVGSSYFSQYEERDIGVSWENLFQSPVYGDDFNLAYVMIMLIIDSFFYLFLTFYIEAVFPGQYGIPKPWYFPFIRYRGKKWIDDAGCSLYGETTLNYEPEPRGLTLGVSIKELGLVYSNGKVAVSGLNLNFYEGQITSLLGHNGAGKTSTISVLTGLYPPTCGTVSIYEQDLQASMNKVRHNLGICPQHNIIFDLLTVEEHLWFYSQLRCQTKNKAKSEIELMIQNIGFLNNRSTLAINLSGGMQRKLSVAAAFIGGAKIVILDEPTSSVDPYSRRAIWDLLIKYKKGRTIILTTHSMDEADLLSDRIAIMVNGHIECYGTSLFLKDQYGSGFRLSVEMGNDYSVGGKPGTIVANIKELTKYVLENIPSAVPTEQKDSSICFTLPKRNNPKALQSLFSVLEEKKDLLAINSYNISDTSLEEIFLRVTEKTDFLKLQSLKQSETTFEMKESKRKTCNQWNWKHFYALLIKRLHHTRRSKKAIFAELLLPSVFIYLAIYATSLEPSLQPRPSLDLNPWIYDAPRDMFYDNNATNLNIWQRILQEIFGSEGLGTRCLPNNKRDESCMTPVNESWYNHTAPDIQEFGSGCSCKTGMQICPIQDKNIIPPSTKLVAGDTMFDLSSSNVSDFLVKMYGNYKKSLFGGYTLGVPSPIPASYNYTEVYAHMLTPLNILSSDQSITVTYSNISTPLQDNSTSLNVKVWYNNKAWASSVAYMNAIKNVILRSYLSSKNASKYGIDAFNHPLPYTEKQKVLFKLDKQPVAVFHAIALLFALSFIPASFTACLVEERASGSKHLQLISGLSNTMYWLHVITWDLICYAVSSMLCICSFLLLQEQAYVSSANLPGLISLLYMYGFSCIPLMYPLSFMFSAPSTAFVATACGNMLLSLSTMIVTILLERFDDVELTDISKILEEIFIVFPHFALGNGIKKLVYSHMTYIYSSLMAAVPPPKPDIFAWDFLGKNLCAMAITGCIFFLLMFLLEYKFFEKLLNLKAKKNDFFPPLDVEEDVARERKRINAGEIGEDVLVMKELCKMYKKDGSLQAVVNHVSLGIKRGECFGLLGLNGAGKTVTLKMLSGKIQSTWGDAMINGWSVMNSLERVRSRIGYCPQYDALDNLLTPKEHLEFYARIRNIPCSKVKMAVDQSLEKFGLVHYKDCIADTLSGGNKRKLSNAIAVMGNPPLLLLAVIHKRVQFINILLQKLVKSAKNGFNIWFWFINILLHQDCQKCLYNIQENLETPIENDEPTSGMDPKSRKFLRSCIKNLVQEGHSIILTSHSMEECQELCTRLTVMVNGQFKCLGSPQYLKNKYGKGYSLILNCKENTLDTVKQFIETALPGGKLAEEKLNHLLYQLPKETVQLDQVFQCIEVIRNDLKDFSVCQTTLEEVFLLLASEQLENIKNKKNLFRHFFRNIFNKFRKTGSLDISS